MSSTPETVTCMVNFPGMITLDYLVTLMRQHADDAFLDVIEACDPDAAAIELPMSSFRCPAEMSEDDYANELRDLLRLLIWRDPSVYARSVETGSLNMISLAEYLDIPFDTGILSTLASNKYFRYCFKDLVEKYKGKIAIGDFCDLIEYACPESFSLISYMPFGMSESEETALVSAAMHRDDCLGVRYLMDYGIKFVKGPLIQFAFNIKDVAFVEDIIHRYRIRLGPGAESHVPPPDRNDAVSVLRHEELIGFLRNRFTPIDERLWREGIATFDADDDGIGMTLKDHVYCRDDCGFINGTETGCDFF